MQINENVALAPYTTFKIGGPAAYLCEAGSLEDIQQALEFAKNTGVSFFILGGGSNVLINDGGFPGLVIKIHIPGLTIVRDGDAATLTVGAGENWDAIVERAAIEKLWGIENLSGIPGTLGGAVVQNIGAYNQALSETLLSVDALDTETGEVRRFTRADCLFEYRSSVFKKEPGRYIILRAALTLSASGKPNLAYKDLQAAFTNAMPTIGEVRNAVILIRKNKFPDLSSEGTAGSFFTNPLLKKTEAEALQAKYPDMPLFSLPETTLFKVPIAWIMDHVLKLHGTTSGSARLFEKQVLVIAAKAGASSGDVLTLAESVEKKVKETTGIELKREVVVV